MVHESTVAKERIYDGLTRAALVLIAACWIVLVT